MPWSNINVDMRRFGAVCCRWHVAVFAVLFACSLMSLFCLDPKLVSTCVILAPSTVDSFMWARRYSAAMLLFFRHVTWVSLIPAPVCPWIARVPGCLCPCARVPVDSSCFRVPVCPEAREETYLISWQAKAAGLHQAAFACQDICLPKFQVSPRVSSSSLRRCLSLTQHIKTSPDVELGKLIVYFVLLKFVDLGSSFTRKLLICNERCVEPTAQTNTLSSQEVLRKVLLNWEMHSFKRFLNIWKWTIEQNWASSEKDFRTRIGLHTSHIEQPPVHPWLLMVTHGVIYYLVSSRVVGLSFSFVFPEIGL